MSMIFLFIFHALEFYSLLSFHILMDVKWVYLDFCSPFGILLLINFLLIYLIGKQCHDGLHRMWEVSIMG